MHAFVNEQERAVGTYLYGRRMYDYHLFLVPVVVGGGKRSLPADVHLDLELVDERGFAGGVVHLHYRPRA